MIERLPDSLQRVEEVRTQQEYNEFFLSHERAIRTIFQAQMDRRQVLQLFAGIGISLVAGGIGGGVERWFRNEFCPHLDWVSEKTLLDRAVVYRDRNPFEEQFGIYPEPRQGRRNFWQQVEQVQKEVQRCDFVGVFVSFEQFQQVEWFESFKQDIRHISESGHMPVISLGVGSKWNNEHPLSDGNVSRMRWWCHFLAEKFKEIGVPVKIRFLYEGNLSDGFMYGTQDLSREEHTRNYTNAFYMFRQEIKDLCPFPVSVVFSPGLREPFEHLIPIHNGRVFADGVGGDIYHLFPGKGRFDHVYYWAIGQESPEELLDTLIIYHEYVDGISIPIEWYEGGSLCRDVEWLAHASLVAASINVRKKYHFNWDKSNERWTWDDFIQGRPVKLHEDDWRLLKGGFRQAYHEPMILVQAA